MVGNMTDQQCTVFLIRNKLLNSPYFKMHLCLTLHVHAGKFFIVLSSAQMFSSKRFFKEYYSVVSNSLDPDHAQHFVGHDLGPTICQDNI